MKKYKIPVEYKMWGLVEVEANSLEDALALANKDINNLPLADKPMYVDDSYVIVAETAEELKEYNS